MSNSHETKTIVRENLQLYLVLSEAVGRKAGYRIAIKVDSVDMTGGEWKCRFSARPDYEWRPNPDKEGVVMISPAKRKVRFKRLSIEKSFVGVMCPNALVKELSGYWSPVATEKKS